MIARLTEVAAEQPTPQPTSAVVSSLDPLCGNAFVARLLRTTPEEDAYLAARFDAADEGRRLYGDESSDAWLAALEDGTHPLCRVPEPPRL